MESENKTYKGFLYRAMKICSRQEKCLLEMHMKLNEWGVPEQFHHAIIQSLVKDKYIDEQRYARSFTRDKFSSNQRNQQAHTSGPTNLFGSTLRPRPSNSCCRRRPGRTVGPVSRWICQSGHATPMRACGRFSMTTSWLAG